MDSAQIQNTLKALCKVMWDNNVTNPITYVTQISYLLFLKMLEEMDHEQKEAGNGNHRSLFGRFESEGEELDFDPLRWSVLASDPDNERMLRTLRDTLPLLARHPKLSQGARAVFRNASVVIPSGAALRRAVDIIAPISFLGIDADVKGDLFEYLASELGGQKKAAQFRTPRHLIRVIVQMVNPKIGQTISDEACGSGGFLIAAYEHILLANTGPEFIREKIGPDGLPRRIGIGDRLSRAQWDFLQKGTFHGFDQSPIVQRDSICGSEDKWDEIQFDNDIQEGIPFFQGKTDFGSMFPTPRKYCTEPSRIAEINDVLISVRAPVGPTNMADQKCCIGRGLAAIRCKDKVLPRFLLYALRNIESAIAESVRYQGGGFTAIKKDQLKAFEIHVPSVDEQLRIVARIEDMTRRSAELLKLKKEIEEELKKFQPALLAKAFRGEL